MFIVCTFIRRLVCTFILRLILWLHWSTFIHRSPVFTDLRTFSLCNCGSQNYATMQAYNFVHSWPFFTLFGSKPHVIDLISCNSLCLNDFQWPYVCFWLYFNIEQKQRLFVCVHLDSKATLFIGHYKENVIIELNFLNRFTWKMAVKTERETNGQMFVFA